MTRTSWSRPSSSDSRTAWSPPSRDPSCPAALRVRDAGTAAIHPPSFGKTLTTGTPRAASTDPDSLTESSILEAVASHRLRGDPFSWTRQLEGRRLQPHLVSAATSASSTPQASTAQAASQPAAEDLAHQRGRRTFHSNNSADLSPLLLLLIMDIELLLSSSLFLDPSRPAFPVHSVRLTH